MAACALRLGPPSSRAQHSFSELAAQQQDRRPFRRPLETYYSSFVFSLKESYRNPVDVSVQAIF